MKAYDLKTGILPNEIVNVRDHMTVQPVEPSSLEDLMQPPTALFDGPVSGVVHCETCRCSESEGQDR